MYAQSQRVVSRAILAQLQEARSQEQAARVRAVNRPTPLRDVLARVKAKRITH